MFTQWLQLCIWKLQLTLDTCGQHLCFNSVSTQLVSTAVAPSLHLFAQFIILNWTISNGRKHSNRRPKNWSDFVFSACSVASVEVLMFALCLHLAGPGGEGGGAASGRGADSALGSGCYRRPAGWEDEPVRQPAGLPGQPVHRHHLPAWQHQPGASLSLRVC